MIYIVKYDSVVNKTQFPVCLSRFFELIILLRVYNPTGDHRNHTPYAHKIPEHIDIYSRL